MEGYGGLEVPQGAFDPEFHTRGFGGGRGRGKGLRRCLLGNCMPRSSRSEDLKGHGYGVGADKPSLAGVPTGAEILDVHGIPYSQPCRKLATTLGQAAFENRGGVNGILDASRVANRLRLLEDRPTAERDEEFFCDFHVGRELL